MSIAARAREGGGFAEEPFDLRSQALDGRRGLTDQDPWIDRRVGNAYRIEALIGKGATGRVYRAIHERIGRPFALKVMREEDGSNSRLRDRFAREVKFLGQLESPYIVRAVDAFVEDARPCFVTELLTGQDLEKRLREMGRLDEEEALRTGLAIARGLAHAHRLGVIHRDLKPSNVFLHREAGATYVKLIDFGVARFAESSDFTETGAVLGTPAYMAPEQALSATHADARADIYALGAIIYRALSGRRPYSGEGSTVLSRLLIEDPPRLGRLRPGLRPECVALVERAMARDPELRFGSAEEMQDSLEQLLDRRERRNSHSSIRQRPRARKAGTWSDSDSGIGASRALTGARPASVVMLLIGIVFVAALSGLTAGELWRSSALAREHAALSPPIVRLAAGLGAVLFGLRGWLDLRHRWRNAASVRQWHMSVRRSLLHGTVVVGVLSGGAAAWAAVRLGSASASLARPAPWPFALALAVFALTTHRCSHRKRDCMPRRAR